jgi:hypothetical protein
MSGIEECCQVAPNTTAGRPDAHCRKKLARRPDNSSGDLCTTDVKAEHIGFLHSTNPADQHSPKARHFSASRGFEILAFGDWRAKSQIGKEMMAQSNPRAPFPKGPIPRKVSYDQYKNY